MFNKDIESYRQKIIDLTNNCGLTVGTALFVIKDIYRDLEQLYYSTIKEEEKVNMDEAITIPLNEIQE